MRHALLAGLALLSSTPVAVANVLVVAPSGAPYTTVQMAIDAAVDGDVILIEPGYYPGFTLNAKSLSIVAEVEGSVAIWGSWIQISNIGVGQCASLAGMNYPAGGLTCTESLGSIRLEAMRSGWPTEWPYSNWDDGLRVHNCADVAVVRCMLVGSNSGVYPSNPGMGLDCVASNVAIHDSTVEGGGGSSAFYPGTGGSSFPAIAGAIGARIMQGSTFYAANTAIRGGRGGAGLPGLCFPFPSGGGPGENGGAGLAVAPDAQAYLLDSTPHGGAGGPGGRAGCIPPPGTPGADGPDVVGVAQVLPGPRAVMQCATHLREQNALALTVEGQPGEQAWLRVSTTSQWLLDLPFQGVHLVGPLSRRSLLGNVPASGTLNGSLFFGAMAPGVEARTWHVQLYLRESTGNVRAGSSAVVVVLDSAF